MKYGLSKQPDLAANDCLVLGFLEDSANSPAIQSLNQSTDGLIDRMRQKLFENGDFLWQSDIQGHSLLLIHCGKAEQYSPAVLDKRLADIAGQLVKQRIHSVTLCLPELADHSADWQLEQMLLKMDYHRYQLLDFKKEKKEHRLEHIDFYLPGASENALKQASSVAEGIHFCRTLANLPANICTPSYLADKAKAMAEDFPKLSCKALGPDEMRQMGMGSLLAVAQGSTAAAD